MPTLTTGQIISFGDGRLACTMDQIYAGLNALLNENLMTHQLVRAGDFVTPHIVEACPWVADLPKLEMSNHLSNEMKGLVIRAWVKDISSRHGDVHEVPDLSGLWIHLDPIDEIIAMAKDKDAEIIVLAIDIEGDDDE